MRALAIHAAEDVRWEERPVPEPAQGEIRLRVRYVGICGSDLHYFFHGANGEYRLREPLVPGHELSAVVDADPAGELEPGAPVTVHPARFGAPVPGLDGRPHLWPGGDYLGSAAVFPHRQGGASEYLVVERGMIRLLPEGLPLERAALAEPLAVALHAVSLAGGVAGRRVLVLGAGPIGLLVVAALADAGHITVADLRPEPLERAARQGADAVLAVGRDAVPEGAFDVVFECSAAAPSVTQAARAVARGGTIVQVGMLPDADIGVNLAPLVSKEVSVRGAFRFADEIGEAVALLAERPAIGELVTHTIPAEEAREAFDIARDASRSGKVLLAL
ncbi:MAG: L-idonate 5-dehydrogenase [Microbacterium sp.]